MGMMKLKGWSKSKGGSHFDRHGRQMGYKNVTEYTNAAKVLAGKDDNVIENKIGNLIFKYDKQKENIHIVNAKVRVIKTFNKAAEGLESFKEAMQQHHKVLKNLGE